MPHPCVPGIGLLSFILKNSPFDKCPSNFIQLSLSVQKLFKGTFGTFCIYWKIKTYEDLISFNEIYERYEEICFEFLLILISEFLTLYNCFINSIRKSFKIQIIFKEIIS